MQRFTCMSADGKTELAAYVTAPAQPRAMVQISHGMCEHILRYEGFAEYLASQGFLVFGHDHLGHGGSAKSDEDLGFVASRGGAALLVEDVHRLSLKMKEEHPDLPIILFGHSMGSFIARWVLEKYGNDYAAGVICGTGGPDTPAGAGRLLASLMILFKGERYRSPLLRSISFSGYLKGLGEDCDRNAWLTRDAAVVEGYNADPRSGFLFTLRAYHDLFTLVSHVSRRAWAKHMPKDLPLLVVSGEADPVGAWGKGVRKVDKRLRDAGVTDVTLRLYPEMRHEILNEFGKEAVWEEICQWMVSKRK